LVAAGVILAFGTLLFLSIRGVRLDIVMFTATAIMALTSGLPAAEVLSVIWRSFSDRGTCELAAAVLTIGLFSTVMQATGFLDKAVSGLTSFLGNVKAALMAVPALVGTMPVLGGAALSAPLVDKLGRPLALSADQKAAINLVFRHGMFFVFPFSTSLILTSKLTGFSVPRLIAKMWPMSLALWGMGYFALLHRVPPREHLSAGSSPESAGEVAATQTEGSQPEQPLAESQGHTRLSALMEFLIYGGPLLLALAFGIALKLPLWLALCGGIGIAVVLAIQKKRPFPSRALLLKGANLSLVVAMFWIMAFRSFVEMTPVFRTVVDKATALGIPPALLAILIPLAFGYANASQQATISVLIPIFVPAAGSDALRLGFTALIYGSSFTAYFFSPLHMCQVLTCQYYDVNLQGIYKRNWPVLAGLLLVLGIFYLSLARL
jgi:hypothetical protein